MSHKLLSVLALTVAVAACDGTGSDGPGSMSLYVTDEPGDFHQAWVQIQRVELVGSVEGASGGVVLMDETDEPFVTNLLELSNDVAALVEDAVVPAGRYSQLRFVIPAGCIEVEGEGDETLIYATDGFDRCGEADGRLQVPSYGASGLKVGLPGGSVKVAGDSHLILLDFKVADTFGRLAGNSGQWVMDPRIQADDVSFSGSITVELTDAEGSGLAEVPGSLGDFQARLDTEEMPVPFTDPDEDGTWTATFLFLMPGSHEASVELKDEFTYDATVDLVSESAVVDLTSGGSATVQFQVTEAAPPPS
jgi:hypothetical protein